MAGEGVPSNRLALIPNLGTKLNEGGIWRVYHKTVRHLLVRIAAFCGGDCRPVRPRLIQSVPGLDPNGTPFERLRQFAKAIVAVPKSEVEKQITKSGSAKNGTGLKGKARHGNQNKT